MKDIFKVFKRDMKSIIKNPIALLIITGLCFIPCLYAWVNIKACWDPYDNTSTISVAVVNNDEGSKIGDKDINIGDEVIKELKDNHRIGWKFVSSMKGNMGIIDGTYYAMIEIPKDFSKDLTSLLSENPIKPEIIYKVNTKSNAVADKITEIAENTLIDQITSNFVDTVNKEAFSYLNSFGDNVDKNKKQIIKLKDTIVALNNNMNLVTSSLQGINSGANNLATFLMELKGTLSSVTVGIDGLNDNTKNIENLVQSVKESLNNSFDNISLNLRQSQSKINEIKGLINNLQNIDNISEKSSNLSRINKAINDINSGIDGSSKFLQSINKDKPNEAISNMIAKLDKTKNNLNQNKDSLNKIQQIIINGNEITNDLIAKLDNNITNSYSELVKLVEEYNSNTRPALNKIADNLISITKDASSLLNTANGMVNQIDILLNSATEGSSLAAKTSKSLNSNLENFKSLIKNLGDKLQDVKDDDLAYIISILQSKPELMGNFISNPFNLKEEAIYPVPNYGSGMAPIYTVLSLWVGPLILTALLKTNVVDFKGSENLTIRQKHFGKMITFIFLSLIQGFLVTFGDKFLLGVQTANTSLFLIMGLVTSLSFGIILYTLGSLLGNIGKAIGVVWMVIQIAGCGGTYPIQVDPKFFRILQPFFPFTYAVGGFREAIAGPLPSNVALDLAVLFIFSIIFILIGFFLKEPLNSIVEKFEEKFKQSGVAED